MFLAGLCAAHTAPFSTRDPPILTRTHATLPRLTGFNNHKAGHHTTDAAGTCESARLCSDYAPRSLCAGGWLD